MHHPLVVGGMGFFVRLPRQEAEEIQRIVAVQSILQHVCHRNGGHGEWGKV